MELKVWVDGVVRVVCGLSLNTSCQDVVIALAQAIGQTGRYILILKLRGTERRLVADDCPLQHLAQLGQLASEVQFLLQRTGPSLSEGPDIERRLPLPRSSEPELLNHREPQRALTFSQGPSTFPRRTKPNRVWSPSPRASPEPRASPVSFLDPLHPVNVIPSFSSKEDVFRQILQQQRRLQHLEVQLQALEKETAVWERSSTTAPGPTVVPAGELEELEERLRQNEAELMHRKHWEEQLEAEMDRERDMHRRLHQMHSSMDDHNYQIKELQVHSAHLEEDMRLSAQRVSSQVDAQQPDEVLRPLKAELQHRLQQAQELEAAWSETQREQQAAEERLQMGDD
uniref:ras association domain-containing protein 8-like isoform X2 n=1 Tax=Scatophagus argus TaxID=75038 RepID=UPI001ED81409|nr:ras association domain-containing protein 8-like isoform X2 [Scatophagus argus]